jgi:lipoprotein-anchoring transpeptidase ErfK/SrfK
MTRTGLLALSGAVLAILAAAAWAADISKSESAAPKAHEQPAPPLATKGRVTLSEAQLLHAYATGTLDREIKTMLDVRKPMRHGEYIWNDRDVPKGPAWIRVDLDAQLISVFRAGHEIGTAVILFGAEEKRTPAGLFPILAKIKDHHSSTYDAPMPYTLRLTPDGVAIHGSNVNRGFATHGCIGVPTEFARLVFEEVRKGDEVLIVARRTSAA